MPFKNRNFRRAKKLFLLSLHETVTFVCAIFKIAQQGDTFKCQLGCFK